MPANTVIPGPPKLTGDHDIDVPMLHRYLGDLHAAAVLQAKLLDPSHQFTPAPFDAANLPDPTNSSIANAQDVANRAYALAQSLVP